MSASTWNCAENVSDIQTSTHKAEDTTNQSCAASHLNDLRRVAIEPVGGHPGRGSDYHGVADFPARRGQRIHRSDRQSTRLRLLCDRHTARNHHKGPAL